VPQKFWNISRLNDPLDLPLVLLLERLLPYGPLEIKLWGSTPSISSLPCRAVPIFTRSAHHSPHLPTYFETQGSPYALHPPKPLVQNMFRQELAALSRSLFSPSIHPYSTIISIDSSFFSLIMFDSRSRVDSWFLNPFFSVFFFFFCELTLNSDQVETILLSVVSVGFRLALLSPFRDAFRVSPDILFSRAIKRATLPRPTAFS